MGVRRRKPSGSINVPISLCLYGPDPLPRVVIWICFCGKFSPHRTSWQVVDGRSRRAAGIYRHWKGRAQARLRWQLRSGQRIAGCILDEPLLSCVMHRLCTRNNGIQGTA